MRHVVLTINLLCATSALCGEARADRVMLVGGGVIEGIATRSRGRVVVQIESGEITLPAEAVTRIEQSESPVERFEARRAALRPGDLASRLALADYCRDHGMRSREHQLLREVLDIDTHNATARARLGYVKTDAGWLSQADVLRAQGMVQHEGRWISRIEMMEIERSRAETKSAAERRATVEAELRLKREELDLQRAERDARQRSTAAQPSTHDSAYPPLYAPVYAYGVPYRDPDTCRKCRRGRRSPDRRAPAAAADSTSLSVVKVPYRNP